jgi:hypothetical protein
MAKSKNILILAIILRVLIMPWFFHPDMKSQHFHFQFLSKRIVNIFSYVEQNKKTLPYTDTFNYLPLTYLSFGTIHTLLKPLYPPQFYQWLNDWGIDQNNYSNLIFYMFILKLPYLIFDLICGVYLLKLFGKKVFNFWLFNPFTIYLIYCLGNFDIIPVTLSVMAYFYLTKNKNFLSFTLLGIASALKLYPLLLLPFFLFYKKPKITNLITNSFYYLLPIILSIAPFLSDKSFIKSFTSSGLSQLLFNQKIFNIPIFPILYLIIFGLFFLKRIKIDKAFLLLFLIFISFVPFHSQWILWFLPFTLYLYNQKNKKIIFLFTLLLALSLFVNFLLNDSFAFFGTLLPINSYFPYLNSPYQIINLRLSINPLIIQTYIKYFIIFISLFLILPKYNENN